MRSKKIKELAGDIVAVVGVFMVFIGARMVYAPLGYILPGLIMVFAGYKLSRGK